MKSLLFSLILIISAVLLIGSASNAQSKESDSNWIDSLALEYRIAFIDNETSSDQASLDSMATRVDILISNLQRDQNCEKAFPDELIEAIQQYNDERRAQHLRRRAYNEEMRSARTNFGN